MNSKIIFMGTASFSACVLLRLLDEGFNVIAVVTQPDRIVGRKKVITMPEVKKIAIDNNIPVLQPVSIKENYADIIDLKADIMITAAYGQIIPEIVLDSVSIGAINVHASLLPSYRGGAPVHKAIIDGNQTTGVTIMYMVKEMDAGNIISNREVAILETDNTGILYERLSIVGADLLVETLPSIIDGSNESIEQDESLVSYAPTIKRSDEHLSFDKTPIELDCFIRGMNPWPGCYVNYSGKKIKIHDGKIHHCINAISHHKHQSNGTIVKIFSDGIGVKVEGGVYVITSIQLEGKKQVSVKDYLNGNNMFEVDSIFN